MKPLTIIIWTLFVDLTDSKALNCSVGWFGSNCQYQCHCKTKQVCGVKPCAEDNCNDDGLCINNSTCDKGWFGPACQYVDLVPLSIVMLLPQEIVDGDDETCIQKQTRNISVKWNTSYAFSWLRLRVKKRKFVHNFTVQSGLNKSPTKQKCKTVDVTSRTLDMHCNVTHPVNQVLITGKGVQSLCSVYISGDRNVALKQNTSQSSTYKNRGESKNAVDGNRNGDYNSGSCTHTDLYDQRPNWNVSISGSVVVTRYVLYNRDTETHRLKKFVITSYDKNNTKVFDYRNKDEIKDVYSINDKNMSQVSFLNIELKGEKPSNRYLTLCEVELYGDSLCEGNKFGRECEHTCNCAGKEKCYVSTGGCPSGCAVGYQGEACNLPCNKGYYGSDCIHHCSPKCIVTDASNDNSSCNHTNGHCLLGCQDGYEGQLCLNEKNLFSNAAIVGSLVAVIILIIVATSVLILFVRSRNVKIISKSSESDGKGVTNILCYGKTAVFLHKNNSLNHKGSTAIALRDLEHFMISHDANFFQQQFRTLPANRAASMIVGKSPENKSKNRYKDICAYDHSRVILQINAEKNHGDYINASYVESYKSDEKFIAAQGPTAAVVEDFVRMLWEIQVEKVVMLTNLTEKGKKKCERYWPVEHKMKVGEITVTLTTTQIFADYTIRKLLLQKDNESAQTLTHFHFTSWPDKDVPATPWGLVDFEQKVTSCQTNKPVVVHCSAGIGRTGTFIALHNLIRQAEETGVVDCFTVVKKLRHDRTNMIQTYAQYEFLHQAVQVAVLCMNATLKSNEIHNRIKFLEKRSKGRETNMEKEFKMICSVTRETCDKIQESSDTIPDQDLYENCKTAKTSNKNRFNNILPKDCDRAILQPELDGLDDYINAVLVPSLSRRDHQILTQLPLPTTVTDFWRLVTQYNVLLIVALEQEQNATDISIGNYLPIRENETATYSFLSIRTEPLTSDILWEKQTVIINLDPKIKSRVDPNVAMKRERQVIHLKCKVPGLDAEKLLALIKEIRSLRPCGEGRTLYLCRSGATYSGLVCVLALLLDRMDNDHHLNVPLVVGSIKAIRPDVISTLDQYKLLYQALKLHSNESNIYSNF